MSEQLDLLTDDDEPSEPAPSPRTRGSRWWSDLRPLVLRLHFYVGMFVGPFILVFPVFGVSLLAFLAGDAAWQQLRSRHQPTPAPAARPDTDRAEVG